MRRPVLMALLALPLLAACGGSPAGPDRVVLVRVNHDERALAVP